MDYWPEKAKRRWLPEVAHCPRAFNILFNCFCGNFTGQWLELCFVSLFKSLYFCIKGGEAFFFFFFLGYIYTSQIRKCPNQIGGQVATGNHSSKPFLVFFFFFHFFLKPHVEGKVNEMSVGCFRHRAIKSFNTERTKEKIKLGQKAGNRQWYFSIFSDSTSNLGILFISPSKPMKYKVIQNLSC